MNESKIRLLQEQFGYKLYQDLIDSGEAWKIGGETTKICKDLLIKGVCFLPHKSVYINLFVSIPSRHQVKNTDFGSLYRSKKYWADEWNMSTEIGKNIMKSVTI